MKNWISWCCQLSLAFFLRPKRGLRHIVEYHRQQKGRQIQTRPNVVQNVARAEIVITIEDDLMGKLSGESGKIVAEIEDDDDDVRWRQAFFLRKL